MAHVTPLIAIIKTHYEWGQNNEELVLVTTAERADVQQARIRREWLAADFKWRVSSFTSDWREELVLKGVPSEVAEGLNPPAEMIAEDEARAREEFWSTRDFRQERVDGIV